MASAVVGLLLPVVLGFVAVTALWPVRRRPDSAFLLKACLALGWGFGVASWAYVLWLVAVGSPGPGLFVAEAVAAVVLLAAFVAVLLRTRPVVESLPTPTPWAKLPLFLTAAFALLVAARVAQVLATFDAHPYGDGDACFNWNMKARFLYRGGEDWRLIFAFPQTPGGAPLSPPDYPLLLPSTIARAWVYRGSETTAEPAAVALLFLVGLYLLLFAGVAALRGPAQGALAGLLLAATNPYPYLAGAQMADGPVAFYVLAAIVSFALYDAHRGGLGWVVLAGMMAGLAGWTKNDGLMLVPILTVVRFAVVVVRDGFRAYAREVAAFAAGLLPFLALSMYHRYGLAPPSYLFLGQEGKMWPRVTDPVRWKLIAREFLGQVIPAHRTHWSGIGYILFMLPVYRLLLGRAPSPARRAALPALLVTLGVLAGYGFIYLITPVDLAWHLGSSFYRLMMHVWPVVLFAFFLGAASPEERLAAGEAKAGPPA